MKSAVFMCQSFVENLTTKQNIALKRTNVLFLPPGALLSEQNCMDIIGYFSLNQSGGKMDQHCHP